MSGWPLLSNELAWRLALADVRAATACLGALESLPGNPYVAQVRERGRTCATLAPGLGGVPWFNRVVGLCQQNALALGELATLFSQASVPLRVELLPCDLTPDLSRRMSLFGLHQSAFITLLLGVARPADSSDGGADFVAPEALAEAWGWPAAAVTGAGWHAQRCGEASGLLYLDGNVGWLSAPTGGDEAQQLALVHGQLALAGQLGCEQVTAQVPPLGLAQRVFERAGLRLVCTQAIWTPRPL